jgi:acetylornithine deacetylase
MKAVAPETGITFIDRASYPALDTAPEHRLVALAKRLAERNNHAKVAYGTEAGLFAATAGIPAVVIGPGSIGEAHRPDEFVERAQLAACARFIDRLIDHCRTSADA